MANIILEAVQKALKKGEAEAIHLTPDAGAARDIYRIGLV